jgi:hypothetical protein
MLKHYQLGEEITLVSKGIQRSEYTKHTWIEERQKGRTSFFKIERIGRVYLYGRYIRFEDNSKELCYYESKVNPTDYHIYRDIHLHLKQAHTNFINRLNTYQKDRDNQRRDLERQANDQVNKQLEIWETQHPRPKLQENNSTNSHETQKTTKTTEKLLKSENYFA